MKLLACSLCALSLVACGDGRDEPSDGDDDVTTRAFTMRIENVAPWTLLKASAQRMKTSAVEGIAGPGEAFEVRFTAAAGHHLSFVSMLHESNDWFFAPDPAGIPLYTNGVPTSGDVTSYVRLWDAGTEADQEPGVGDATCNNQLVRDAGLVDPDRRVRVVPDTMILTAGGAFTRPSVAEMIVVTLTPGADRQFTLRIQNISTATTLVTSAGPRAVNISPFVWSVHRDPGALFVADAPPPDNGLEALAEAGQPDAMSSILRFTRGVAGPLSRGVVVVHHRAAPLFAPGTIDRRRGLEALAEDGDELPLLDELRATPPEGVTEIGALDTPVGAAAPAALAAGQAFEVTLHGRPGDALSFATMFGASNDWFFATPPDGIALFHGDLPRWGDVSTELRLYDLGTEADEELDVGPNTAPHQSAPDTGRDDRVPEVREVTVDRYETPVIHHLRVTLTPALDGE